MLAELDAMSIILLILAIAIAPWVLPTILRVLSAEKKSQEDHIKFWKRNNP